MNGSLTTEKNTFPSTILYALISWIRIDCCSLTLTDAGSKIAAKTRGATSDPLPKSQFLTQEKSFYVNAFADKNSKFLFLSIFSKTSFWSPNFSPKISLFSKFSKFEFLKFHKNNRKSAKTSPNLHFRKKLIKTKVTGN